ncbi:MAG: hypothetical protein JRF63_13620 [Deltaproteobacteria bacterium]|nr:hypothetical protein [Deltaproteobacteria bacterium]
MPVAIDRRELRRFSLAAAVVVIASAVTVLPAIDGEFLNWDDDRFILNNPHVDWLSGGDIAWAFGATRFEAYQPLHMVSYMVDGSLWPNDPTLYRVHSLVLYLAALVLVLALLLRLGFETIGAALGTLLFALAPFHVESVAWIAGRKDVLALLFSLAAWHLHLSANGAFRRRALMIAGSVVLFLCALLSKSTAMVVPVMMIAADVGLDGVRPRSALVRAAPCLLLSIVAGVTVANLWSGSELIRPEIGEGALGRVGLVGWSLFHYLATLAWPFRLSPLYADPVAGDLLFGGVGALIVCAIATVTIVVAARRGWSVRGPLVAVIWFAVGIAPFLNAVPLYYLVADRYLLFPSLGLALAGALLANALLRLSRIDRRVIGGAGLLLLAAAWGMGRVDECRAWRDSRSLWTHAVEREPDAFFARLKLAETLRESDDPAGAADQYRQARRINSGSRLALTGLFWSELLADGDANQLSESEIDRLVLRFAGSLDDGRSLRRLVAWLRGHELDRAAEVVQQRIERDRASPKSIRKRE